MKRSQSKRAIKWQEKHPHDLVASDVTVAELARFLQTLPQDFIIYAVDSCNDETTRHIQIETELHSQMREVGEWR